MTFWVLPAHAGVILTRENSESTLLCITRTCGGDPEVASDLAEKGLYYPHMRG